ncbi:ATP-dependent RNA helicase DeaD [Desulfonatronum thiosulfatophilum]|uniref:ATP-dependent RNA helicase DeaD n=1 Tax=Desulfonatronum thiosulfatophilum TaxID=617002 RepID=A0A1G6D6G1_9BACT|nr:DEAD/DEAH box helicase [Desulfonatronum thiosulfatophilum]SDB40747.1 ATP-dependent RNA helicase DeaD [Desulfonatronum thiosulfatophilum]
MTDENIDHPLQEQPEAPVPDDDLHPETTLGELPEVLRQACARAGWSELTPVQKKAIPHVLAGRDIMAQARTGSGKTGAFILPLLERIDPKKAECQALVLVPTRELARQVSEEASVLAGDTGLNVVPVYGGTGYQSQIDAFRQGAHLVVGTPGRILDHLLSRNLNLDHIRVLIFDEADRMLSVGFYPDMRELQRYLPRGGYAAFMFSATYPESVIRLGEEFLNKPIFLGLSGDQVHIAEIEHVYCVVPRMSRDRVLIRLLEMENPSSAIIFCNTKNNVEYVAAILKQYGFDAEDISSNLSQVQRERVLARIRGGKLRFLVATDVAGRGIDIPGLSHVFLYEAPEDPESYIHRAGRTGRAGATGRVITLVDIMEKIELGRIAARFNINMLERKTPEEEDVTAVLEDRITVMLENKRRTMTLAQKERTARFVPTIPRFAHNEDTSALLAILLDELYQQTMNVPPPKPEEKPAPKATAMSAETSTTESQPKKKRRRRKPKKDDQGDSSTGDV